MTALDGTAFGYGPVRSSQCIGDNGAGKSTLIKALSGALVPDRGMILVDGLPVHFRSPSDARRAGIETLYQDLAVAPALSIAENLFLGRELRRPGVLGSVLRMLDKRRMLEESSKHLQELGISVLSMTQAVETLSGGQRQGVAVARSAAFARHVVILDEPTAALGKEGRWYRSCPPRASTRSLVVLISHNHPTSSSWRTESTSALAGPTRGGARSEVCHMNASVAVMTVAMAPEYSHLTRWRKEPSPAALASSLADVVPTCVVERLPCCDTGQCGDHRPAFSLSPVVAPSRPLWSPPCFAAPLLGAPSAP